MSSFSTKIYIDVPLADVWEALADIGNIYLWNPGVESSRLISEESQGIGAARYCDLGGGNFLEERVIVWDPNRALTMRIRDTNLPFRTADIRFTLRSDGERTEVEVSPICDLKFGVFGKVLDTLYVRASYKQGMENLLRGLKKYVEGRGV